MEDYKITMKNGETFIVNEKLAVKPFENPSPLGFFNAFDEKGHLIIATRISEISSIVLIKEEKT
jgi:hypothetical protein